MSTPRCARRVFSNCASKSQRLQAWCWVWGWPWARDCGSSSRLAPSWSSCLGPGISRAATGGASSTRPWPASPLTGIPGTPIQFTCSQQANGPGRRKRQYGALGRWTFTSLTLRACLTTRFRPGFNWQTMGRSGRSPTKRW